MKYLIYCKKTHKLLAVYTNAKSLETLDTDKCYYREQTEVEPSLEWRDSNSKRSRRSDGVKLSDIFGSPMGSDCGSSRRASGSRNRNDNSTDYMNPVNPIGFYSSSYSDCSSSSGSSDSSSSSSSSSCE